jgi:hypothetical protein
VIVTVTGAKKNVGDHLIGYRARALVREHADPDVVNVNRHEITDRDYETMAQARAVLLAGGGAYQPEIYPKFFNLDLDRIDTPVLSYGLGFGGALGQTPEQLEFSPEAKSFVERIHQDATRFSSARDHFTVDLLAAQGIKNVALTGCPAWYDLAKIDQDYRFDSDPKTIAISAPTLPQPALAELITRVKKRFPLSNRYLVFNAGTRSARGKNPAAHTRWNYYLMAHARLSGFRSVNLEGDLDGFQDLMGQVDLHIGYHTESHLCALSQRRSSILIAEDSYGFGQLLALGTNPEDIVTTERTPTQQADSLDKFFDTAGSSATAAVAAMRERYPEMVRFLKQL